jgi:2-polyprenyl-3-methyl-5-hydroxy-6-metoxy-1,4-benzoquinol methylase
MSDTQGSVTKSQIYEQRCAEFRSLNGFFWQIPLIVMTLNGGLWFAVASLDVTPVAKSAILCFAGVGRDALSLAQLGYRVSAVEPSIAMREAGEHRTAGAVDWMDDSLPCLSGPIAGATRYHFILCSAVLMHVRPGSLPASLSSMSALLAPTGRLAVTLRAPQSDDPSNVFFDHSDQALLDAAASAGLEVVASGRNADSFVRPLVWRWFVFQKH